MIYHYYDGSYFDAYWTGNAISVLLAVTVMDEILHNLFKTIWRYSEFRIHHIPMGLRTAASAFNCECLLEPAGKCRQGRLGGVGL